MAELGKLKEAPLSEAWDNEAEFTDWLASDDGVELLSGALGLKLEAVATEQSIGSFRADLICRDATEGALVIVENQMTLSDHRHLGQVMTYSAGAKARTIVWIADKFRDEHRAAVDWHNETSNEDVRFYALEIELWKMGEGRVGPRLNVVSQPNDWRKVVSLQTESEAAGETRGGFNWIGFWARVNEKIESRHGFDKLRLKNRDYDFFDSKLARRFKLGASIYPGKGILRVDVSTQGANRFALASQLYEARDEIEKEIGQPLTWELSEVAKRNMMMLDRPNVDLKDTSNWDEYAEWMVEHLAKLRRAFWDRVDELDREAGS